MHVKYILGIEQIWAKETLPKKCILVHDSGGVSDTKGPGWEPHRGLLHHQWDQAMCLS